MDALTARIGRELRHHAPFTLFGALTGIIIVIGFSVGHVPHTFSHHLFEIFHPLHVLLSAIVTSAMYRIHAKGTIVGTVIVGYVGAVGIGTLSDSLIPFLGESLLGMEHAHAHIGFIEEWYLVNPLALAGVAIGIRWPKTHIPHAGHVLLSTWASLFHMTAAMGEDDISFIVVTLITVFLFLAVWLPCCLSDIVFPLLFAKKSGSELPEETSCCGGH